LQEAGFYSDVELGEPSSELDDIEKQKAEEMGMSAVQDERYRILEMHVDLDLKATSMRIKMVRRRALHCRTL
jgi:hypothetical protein